MMVVSLRGTVTGMKRCGGPARFCSSWRPRSKSLLCATGRNGMVFSTHYGHKILAQEQKINTIIMKCFGNDRRSSNCSPLEMGERVCIMSMEFAKKMLVILGSTAILSVSACPAFAGGERIAEFATSGLIPVPGLFRDTVQVDRITDPDVDGVTLYYTDYSRSLSEKLSSDPFADPSQSSLTCIGTSPVVINSLEKVKGGDGKEIFSELKTLNIFQNKRLNIRRIYDEKQNAVIYVSYSTRFSSTQDEGGVSSSRYRTSICAVPVAKVNE